MLLLDLTHTSHTGARTGIQRVARSLSTALRVGGDATAICFDPWQRAWRPLERWEEKNLSSDAAAARRGARWPWPARLRGILRRRAARSPAPLAGAEGLIVPEVFSPAAAAALPALFALVRGPRVALFHDAIALQLPELSPAKTVARFPAYLQELSTFDGIAAISEDSRRSLLDYWRWLGLPQPPPVAAIPLGLDQPGPPATPPSTAATCPPTILCVGSIEGRKNHLALLDACEQLWTRGTRFNLHLLGLARPQTAATALARITALQRSGRPLRYDGAVGDAAVEAAYGACTFTVYPSLREGFGLPVLESLAHGKPCICSASGALGEAARDGGCLALPAVDAASLAAAIAELLQNPVHLSTLAAQARARTVRSWDAYALELTAWMRILPRRG
ncbi:MAG TPA: glycosyltransferase [Opitutaceae bacterium]|nr:glycosyltransferase [Opitutaceae bacterium]